MPLIPITMIMKTEVFIKGTHCASCKALIEDVAQDVPGIQSCSVDFKTGKTVIEHDESVDWAAFDRAIKTVGDYSLVRGN